MCACGIAPPFACFHARVALGPGAHDDIRSAILFNSPLVSRLYRHLSCRWPPVRQMMTLLPTQQRPREGRVSGLLGRPLLQTLLVPSAQASTTPLPWTRSLCDCVRFLALERVVRKASFCFDCDPRVLRTAFRRRGHHPFIQKDTM